MWIDPGPAAGTGRGCAGWVETAGERVVHFGNFIPLCPHPGLFPGDVGEARSLHGASFQVKVTIPCPALFWW